MNREAMSQYILAIDSSAETASAALCDGENLIAASVLNDGRMHSENLLPMVENLLAGAGIGVSDVDVFAGVTGPGSFTGVRIGISLIKGLAFGSAKPCIGVSALESLAWNLVGLDGLICPVMDARREQVYNALFRMENGALTRLCEDRLIPAASLAAEIAERGEAVWLVGDGIALMEGFGLPTLPTPTLLAQSHGYGAARAALAKIAGRSPADLPGDRELIPVYLRPTQAERDRLERLSDKETEKETE